MTDQITTIEQLAAAFGTHHDQVKEALKNLGEKSDTHSGRLLEVEQRMIDQRHSAPGNRGGQSLGAQFIAQTGVQEFATRNARNDRFQFETRATVTSSTADAAGAAGAGLIAYRDPTIVPLPSRRPIVRDLLPVLPMEGGSVDVVRVKGRTRNAAPVAEGAAKPGSDLQLGLEPTPARTIAHWIKASRQILSDMPQLAGLIDSELMDGLALEEEDQLLGGDGTGQNLKGLIPSATAFAAPFVIEDATMLDTIGLALLQSALALHPADGIVMNPADWTRITLLKNAQGEYIMGPPGSAIEPRLWGVPVVPTPAIAVDQFLVGQYRAAATIYDRWVARVEVGTVNDDFTNNLVTILAEERLALAIKDGTALTYGAFGNGA